jgi:hypothetical protein
MSEPNLFKNWKMLTCQHCLKEYELGKDGTLNGCDKCEGIERDEHGHIIVKRPNGITSIRRQA